MDAFNSRKSALVHRYSVKNPGLQFLDKAVKLDDPESLNFDIDNSQDQIPATACYVLKRACMHGSRKTVKFILKKLGKQQISKLDRSLAETTIRTCGDREIVKYLFDAGINRTDLTEIEDTDILLAVRFDKCALLKDLVSSQEGALLINRCNKLGVFPLFLAIKLRHINCMKILLQAGADINQRIEKCEDDPGESMADLGEYAAQIEIFARPMPGDSLMHVVLKKLGVRIFYKNDEEYLGYESIFHLLINSNNLDLTVTNGSGQTLLDEAIISLCDTRVLNRLIEKGCRLLIRNPYHYVSFEDTVEKLEIVKRLGFEVNSQDAAQFSPLFVACLDHNVKVVRWLLDNGANPTTYASSGVLQNWIASVKKFTDYLLTDQHKIVTRMTPLHVTLLGSMSVFMSAIPIVEMICRRGADLNAQTCAGDTPLFYATRDVLGDDNFPLLPAYFEPFGPEESLFILLVQAGCDPEIGTKDGQFPITFCIPESLTRIALMFLEVSTNLLKYIAVEENERKACHISDLSFLPLDQNTITHLVTNPRKLQVLCRKTIIQACQGRHVNNGECFKELPKKVQNYLTLKYLKEPEWYRNPNTLL